MRTDRSRNHAGRTTPANLSETFSCHSQSTRSPASTRHFWRKSAIRTLAQILENPRPSSEPRRASTQRIAACAESGHWLTCEFNGLTLGTEQPSRRHGDCHSPHRPIGARFEIRDRFFAGSSFSEVAIAVRVFRRDSSSGCALPRAFGESSPPDLRDWVFGFSFVRMGVWHFVVRQGSRTS